MDKIELSIIIVDYKSQKYSIPLVIDLEKRLKSMKFEIVIVDNDPVGKTNLELSQKLADFANVKIVKAKKNLGYGAGNNLGVKQAQGEFLLLLNPDTEIVDDAIGKMLDFMSKHAEIGALTPIIQSPDGQIQRHFFGRFQSLSSLLMRNQAGILTKNPPNFFYADMLTGAAMMIRRSLFEKLDGFDENFFMYLEDEDLCRRISNLGLKNAVLTIAKIIHHEGQSSTSFEKKKFYYQSQDYYWQKHYGSFITVLMKIIRSPYVILQKLR